jgi:hypothetical protein
MRPFPDMSCLACGEPIEETLFRLGSPRCLDCRQTARPLDPRLVDPSLAEGGPNGPAAPFGIRHRPTELAD